MFYCQSTSTASDNDYRHHGPTMHEQIFGLAAGDHAGHKITENFFS